MNRKPKFLVSAGVWKTMSEFIKNETLEKYEIIFKEEKKWVEDMAYVERVLYEQRLFGNEDHKFNAREAIDLLLKEVK